MWQYSIKILITSVLVVAITESAKRWTLLGAVIASLPITSILAMTWLYLETDKLEKVSALSYGIFWVVVPSLVFFLLFPLFVKMGWNYWFSIGSSCAGTALTYWGYLMLLEKLGVKI